MCIFCSTRYKEKEKEGSDHLADERAGPSEIGPPLAPQVLTDKLTLFQSRGADYPHHLTTCPLGFLDLPTP